ncbi:MAG: zeta toxin family protein [Chitinophagales bacterium]|nr:zeta toxin family protein [Chitinophagales bacterium]
MAKTSRPLNNFELVEHFLENALNYDFDIDEKYGIVPKIVSTELNIENFDETLISVSSKSYRIAKYRSAKSRRKLRETIVLELLTQKRLEKDEDIELGKGGAFPLTTVQTQFNAYIITGLPASGKSGISNIVADKYGGYILDSDYAKRKLPEFTALPFGATLVHEESDRIVFGENNPARFKSLFDYCKEVGANIILPKIGSNFDGLLGLIEILKKSNYKVHLTLVELDRVKATKRALTRFDKTDRYVPLGLIFDTYANNPTIAFYKAITHRADLIESYGIISTDVKEGEEPKCILKSNTNNPANLFKA